MAVVGIRSNLVTLEAEKFRQQQSMTGIWNCLGSCTMLDRIVPALLRVAESELARSLTLLMCSYGP